MTNYLKYINILRIFFSSEFLKLTHFKFNELSIYISMYCLFTFPCTVRLYFHALIFLCDDDHMISDVGHLRSLSVIANSWQPVALHTYSEAEPGWETWKARYQLEEMLPQVIN